MTDVVIVTVLIERQHAGRVLKRLARDEASSNRVLDGFVCDHDSWDWDRADVDVAGAAQERCGWCDSQGKDGELRPAVLVECAYCEGLMTLDEFVEHIRTSECF